MTQAKNPEQQDTQAEEKRPSSHGTDSASVTPKDRASGAARADDVVAREATSGDPDEKREEMLDDELELTFPASDPLPSPGGITRVEQPAKK